MESSQKKKKLNLWLKKKISQTEEKQFINRVKKNKKKRKNPAELPRENEISDDEQHVMKKTKNGSSKKVLKPKELHQLKRKAIQEISEQRDILGFTKNKDATEEVLEEIIFGRGENDLEDYSSDSHSEEEEKSAEVQEAEVSEIKPVWHDEDDEITLVEEKANELIKCHRSIASRGSEKLSSFVEEQFKKVVGEPKWAEIGRKESSGDESGDDLLRKTGNYIEQSKSLPKGCIQIQKCPSLVDEHMKKSIIKSVEFHPSSRVAVVASTNGTASLFQIDGKINAKIQSVHFANFPIHTAHFTLSGHEIIFGSNAHGHYFSYDMMSGRTVLIPWDKGMEQMNVRRFHMSPDGKYIIINGRYGYIHIVTAKSKEWVGSLKMNGEVIAITFNKDGSKMFSHGDTGEVYVWDMNARKCIHKFVDEGCITGTSIAISPNDQFLAAGSDTGVVNIYDNSTILQSKTPKPVKVLMNLTTEASVLKFNCTSELLAMSSSHKENAIKLVHFPSMSIFSNFPVQGNQSKLNYINSLDISVNSGYLALGNNLSTVHIFRLKHYSNY